jgi:DNA polymerase I-like protein with 3'-5' exonuclease and polymerase domains
LLTIFDVETTTFNKGHPFDPRNVCVCYSVKFEGSTHFRYYTDPDFISFLRDVILRTTTLVGFNIKFDLHWLWNLGIKLLDEVRVFDCSLAEFILSGQQLGMVSLNESLESYGLPTKKDAVAEFWNAGVCTKDISVELLREYNMWDVECTELLYKSQLDILTDKQKRLLWLEGQDLLALAAAERAGIKWDAEGANDSLETLERDVAEIEAGLSAYLPALPDSCSFNWDSGDQLSALLYGGVIKYEYSVPEQATYKSGPNKNQTYIRNRWFSSDVMFPQRFRPLEGSEVKKTIDLPLEATHFYQVDAPTLKQLRGNKYNKELLLLLQRRAEKIKVVEMIKSINKKFEEKNWQDGCIHPSYNQNIVITGRLSSSGPNMQNTPPEIDKFLISRY